MRTETTFMVFSRTRQETAFISLSNADLRCGIGEFFYDQVFRIKQ